MIDFGGWDMPLHYGSQVEEHHQVRRDAGLFDVSHMTVVDLAGPQAQDFLRYLLANDVARLKAPGRALYSCMLNAQGAVLDDLIVYYFDERRYRLVVNAATRVRDLAWLQTQAVAFDVGVEERADLAMIAVQGPMACVKTGAALGEAVAAATVLQKPFSFVVVGEWFIARTGYTGEDGCEIILPAGRAVAAWRRLRDAGVRPVGLGARDTLRLEAGLNLYGTDMDEHTTPLDCGLAWTVAWQPEARDFIGRAALAAQQQRGDSARWVGLVLEGKGVLRGRQTVIKNGEAVGEITSGSFSPTLGRAIALARLRADVGGRCEVEVRGRALPARVVQPPFVRRGRPCIDVE